MTRIDAFRVGKDHDGRRRLSDEDKAEIVVLHAAGRSIHGLAREFECSRRLVQFIIYPERLAIVNFPGHWSKYYDKEKHRRAMAKHRAKKRELFNASQNIDA